VNAVDCAVAVQQQLAQANETVPADRRLEFRIGIHVGDVMVQAGDLFGDSVNIAARIESLAGSGGICLSASALEHVHKWLPHGVVDLGRHQVKNIAEPIGVYALAGFGPPMAAAGCAASRSLPLPDQPSIAVLPFTNIGGDPEQEYFADGLVEDIITSLSRVRSFFVIARNSSFTYKGRSVDVKQVGRELGVRYVLEGSIRKAGARVRIVGQLIDAATGHHVWADRFDGDVTDIFDLQDRVTESVVGSVEPSIRLQEIRQARAKPTSFISAYDLYLRALPRFYAMTQDGFADVRRLTNEALAIDPGFNLARALGAYIRSISVSQCWHEPDDIRVAVRMAREVHAEARDDPTCLRFAAQVLAYSAKDYETALSAIERSLQLNPNSAQGYTGGGWVNAHSGRPLVAIEHFHRAMRLSPLDPEKGIALSGIGMSYLMLEQFEDALSWGQRALREMPGYGSSHRVVICALVGLGRVDEAQGAARRLLEAFPTYTVTLQREINPWRDTAFAERYLQALRLAGVPD
jgi:adenylate cyclase